MSLSPHESGTSEVRASRPESPTRTPAWHVAVSFSSAAEDLSREVRMQIKIAAEFIDRAAREANTAPAATSTVTCHAEYREKVSLL